MPRSAMLLGPVLVGAALMAPVGPVGEFGIAPAEAAPGYYTRKKVNGRWITGKFPKGSAGAKPASGGSGPAASLPASGGRPATILIKRGAAAKLASPRRVRFVERKGVKAPVARYAALPKYKPHVALKRALDPKNQDAQVTPRTPAAVSVPPPVMATPRAEPMAAAKPDLSSLPPDRVLSTASISPAPVVAPGIERMRPALEAKARSMASELATIAIPLPEPAPPAVLATRSVSFDRDRGLRTTVFEDGTTVTVPFERSATGEPAGARPNSP